MRVGYVFVPHFAVQVERLLRGSLDGKPVVVGGFSYEGRPVYDASPEATACGVTMGMPLRQASVLCPEACFLPCDEGKYREMFERVLNLLEQFSSLLEAEGLGSAYFDASGVEDEKKLALEIAAAIHGELGLKSQLGIAGNKFVARTAAMLAKADDPIIVAGGEEAGFLAPLGVDILLCSVETRERLHLLGIRGVGQLTAFTREALLSQFGKEGELLHNLAHGIDHTALVPRKAPGVLVKTVHLDVPISTLSQIIAIVKGVVEDIAASLKGKWRVCRKVSLRLASTSGAAVEETFNLKQPTSSAEKILSRLESGLARLKLQGDVTEITLSFEVEMDRGDQLKLLKDARRSPLDGIWRESGRRWHRGLKRVKPRDPDALLPEERYQLIDFEPDGV